MSKKSQVSIGEDMEKLEPIYSTGGHIKWCSHFRKQSGSSQWLYIELAHDPTIPTYRDMPKRNLCPYKSLYIEVHSSVIWLFITTKKWKQPNCPSTNG